MEDEHFKHDDDCRCDDGCGHGHDWHKSGMCGYEDCVCVVLNCKCLKKRRELFKHIQETMHLL